MVATWAFDLALKVIVDRLDPAEAPQVLEAIRNAMPPRQRFLPLDEAPVGEVAKFLAAARRARHDVAAGRGAEWDSDAARDSFLGALDDLTTKLEARLKGGASAT